MNWTALAPIDSHFSLIGAASLRATTLLAVCLVFHAVLYRRTLLQSSLWNACLLGLLLSPLASLSLPRVEIALPPAAAPSREQWSPAPRPDLNAAPSNGDDAEAVQPPAPVVGDRDSHVRSASSAAAVVENRPSHWPDVRLLALVVYGCGALVLLARVIAGFVAVNALRRTSAAVVEPLWHSALSRWRQHLEVRENVLLAVSDRVSIPVVVGWKRSMIVLPPRMARSQRAAEIDAVLLHELAHVGRRDYAWNLLLELVQAIYWPHPFVWLAARFIRDVRERAADDQCVHWLGGPDGYRNTLLDVVAGMVRRPAASLGLAMARGPKLKTRLAWIARTQGSARCLLNWPTRLGLTGVVASLAVGLGVVQLARLALAADAPDKSPLDAMSAEKIPVVERYPWQPKELVGVIGTHANKAWVASTVTALSEDGHWFATANNSESGVLSLWDAATCARRAQVAKAHGVNDSPNPNWIGALAFSPDGLMLASAGRDGVLRLWDVDQGGLKPLSEQPCLDDLVFLKFSPDGKTLAARDRRRPAQLWAVDGVAARLVTEISKHEKIPQSRESDIVFQPDHVNSIAFSPTDGTLLTGGGDGMVYRWDVETGKELASPIENRFPKAVAGLAFSANGAKLAVASQGSKSLFYDSRIETKGVEIHVYDMTAGNRGRRKTIPNVSALVFDLTLNGAGSVLAFSDGSGVEMWDLAPEAPQSLGRLELPLIFGAGALYFSADGSELLCWSLDVKKHRWRVGSTPSMVVAPNGRTCASAIYFTQDGGTLVSLERNAVRFWDLHAVPPIAKQTIDIPDGFGNPFKLSFSADEKLLAFSVYALRDETMRIWDLSKTNPRELAKLKLPKGQSATFWSSAFSPNQKTLATGLGDGTIRLWDLTGEEVTQKAHLQEGASSGTHVCSLAYSRDGQWFAAANANSTVRLWDVSDDSAKLVNTFSGHRITKWSNYVRVCAFSNDCKTLVSGDEHGMIRLSDVETKQEKTVLLDHASNVSSIYFFSDDERWVSSAYDGSVVVHSLDGKQLRRWDLPTGVKDAVPSPDGRYLAVSNANGTIYILRL